MQLDKFSANPFVITHSIGNNFVLRQKSAINHLNKLSLATFGIAII